MEMIFPVAILAISFSGCLVVFFLRSERMKELCFEVLECERFEEDLTFNTQKINGHCGHRAYYAFFSPLVKQEAD